MDFLYRVDAVLNLLSTVIKVSLKIKGLGQEQKFLNGKGGYN